jgi:integrase
MSVYKDKKSKFYTYDFWFKNRRYKDITDATTEADALKAEKHVRETALAEFKLGKKSGDGVRMTFKDATNRYNHEVAQHLAGQGPDIVLRDLERLRDWVEENAGENALVTDITDDSIAKLVSWRRGQRVMRLRRVKGKKDLQQDPRAPFVKPATVNRSTTELLKKIFIRSRDTWKVHFEDWPQWKTHMLKAHSEVINDLQEGQGEALMEATRGDYAPAIEFEHVTGWRQGAVIALEWEQVNWGKKTIRFPTKPGKQERTIEINSELYAILWPLMGHDPTRVFTYVAQRTLLMKRPDGLLDKRVKGQRYPITASGFKTEWKRAKAKAGIKKFRNHDLRHAFGTALYDETGDIYAVQNAMGHADVKTTMRYVHRRQAKVNVAIAEIAKNRLRKVEKTSGQKGIEKSPPSPRQLQKSKKIVAAQA